MEVKKPISTLGALRARPYLFSSSQLAPVSLTNERSQFSTLDLFTSKIIALYGLAVESILRCIGLWALC